MLHYALHECRPDVRFFREMQIHHFTDGFVEPDYAHLPPVDLNLPDPGKGIGNTW
jgi:hypothetical protein